MKANSKKSQKVALEKFLFVAEELKEVKGRLENIQEKFEKMNRDSNSILEIHTIKDQMANWRDKFFLMLMIYLATIVLVSLQILINRI